MTAAESKLKSFNTPFLRTVTEFKDPKTETFWDMLRLNMCYGLTFYSFSVFFVFVLLSIFCLEVVIDGIDVSKGDKARIAAEFLPIKIDGFISAHLTMKGDNVKNHYEFYRLATSLFIHSNAMDWFYNSITLVIWASFFEQHLTMFRTAIIFVFAGKLTRLDG